MQRQFEVQETERRHLARELHDELGQWLSAMQAHARLITDLAGDDLLRNASALTRLAMRCGVIEP